MEEPGYTYEYLERRGISRETHEFFGVKTRIDAAGKPVAAGYVYPNGSTQIRMFEPKNFYSIGDWSHASGFAKDRFAAGSAKAITITEGEGFGL